MPSSAKKHASVFPAHINCVTDAGIAAGLFSDSGEPDSFSQLVIPRASPDADKDQVEQHFVANRQRLEKLITKGHYSELNDAAYYAVQLFDPATQTSATGLLCKVSADAIQPHEAATQNLNDIIDQLKYVGYFETAVSLAHYPKDANNQATLSELLTNASHGKDSVVSVTDERGIEQTLWRIENPANIVELVANSDLLLLDGHHRWNAAQFITDSILGLVFDSQDCTSGAFHRHLTNLSLGDVAKAIEQYQTKQITLSAFTATNDIYNVPNHQTNQIPLWGYKADLGWGFQLLEIPIDGVIDNDLDVIRFRKFCTDILGPDTEVEYIPEEKLKHWSQPEDSVLALMAAPSIADLMQLARPIEAPKATNFKPVTKLAPGIALMPCQPSITTKVT